MESMGAFYTINTMTIDRCSELLLTEDVRLMLRYRIPCPRRILMRRYEDFMSELSRVINERGVQQYMKEWRNRIRLYNRINMYRALLRLIVSEDDRWKDLYREVMNMIPGEDAADRVVRELDAFTRRYDEINQKPADTGDSFDFEDYIIFVQIVLGVQLPRTLKLIQFKKYLRMAIETNRKREDNG